MHDDRFARMLGVLLRIGVSTAAVVVLAGGTIYLIRHATEPVSYAEFDPDRLPNLRSLSGIVDSALGLSGRGVIQLGLMVLIATPVFRVAFSVAGFVQQRDRTYIVLTLVVLAILLYSLFIAVK